MGKFNPAVDVPAKNRAWKIESFRQKTRVWNFENDPDESTPSEPSQSVEIASGWVVYIYKTASDRTVYGNYVDELLQMKRGSNSYYYHQNTLFSVAALTDVSGAVVERYAYDAYGQPTVMDASYNVRSGGSSYSNRYLFTGREFEAETGLYHYRARAYDPGKGRFVQRDSVGVDSGEANLYRYCWNNPANRADSTGLWGENIHYTETKNWARMKGITETAAELIGQTDIAVDGGDWGLIPIYTGRNTSFLPAMGDQSYHFNRGGDYMDSRLQHFEEHFNNAKTLCSKGQDDPEHAAQELGVSLHPLQDWVAHGDFNMRGDTTKYHNSDSPQTNLGTNWRLPDDISLDAIGSTDGRPAGNAMVRAGDKEFAIFTYGTKRFYLTKQKTEDALRRFVSDIKSNGGCKCKRYFFGGDQ